MSAAIAKKMIAVSKAVGHIEKGGYNQHFKFKFQAWDDVLPAVRDALAEHGLWIIPSATLKDRTGDNSMVDLTFRIIDTDTGEEIIATWIGEGKDNQDKGFQKAATSGVKYWLLKAFQIPCEGVEDSDALGPEQKPKAEQKPKPAQQSKADVEPPARNGYTTADAGSYLRRICGGENEGKAMWRLATDTLTQLNPPMAVTEFCKQQEAAGVGTSEDFKTVLVGMLSAAIDQAVAS